MSPQINVEVLLGTTNVMHLCAGCNGGLATMLVTLVYPSSYSPSSLSLLKAPDTDEKRNRLTEMPNQFSGEGGFQVRLMWCSSELVATEDLLQCRVRILCASSRSPSIRTLRKAPFTDEKRGRLTQMSINAAARGSQVW